MKVFQLTLLGWQAENCTDASEECVKLVRCENYEVLNDWLEKTGLIELVREIDDNPPDHWKFEDGVDVRIEGQDVFWSESYGVAPKDEWRATVTAATNEIGPRGWVFIGDEYPDLNEEIGFAPAEEYPAADHAVRKFGNEYGDGDFGVYFRDSHGKLHSCGAESTPEDFD